MNLRGLYYPIYQDDVRHLSIGVQQRFTHPGLPNGSSMEHTIAVAQVPAGLAPQSAHPNIVGLDELAWRRGHRYGTIVCDLEQHRIVDLPVRKSIQDDFIICLENGRPFKSLKPHLFSAYGLTPDEHRAKWGLPKNYPMVAPAYANARAMLARQISLGRGSSDARLVASLPKPSLDVQAKRVPERAEVTIEQPRPAADVPKRRTTSKPLDRVDGTVTSGESGHAAMTSLTTGPTIGRSFRPSGSRRQDCGQVGSENNIL